MRRSGLRSLAHLVVPSVIWIGAVAIVLRTYDLSTVLVAQRRVRQRLVDRPVAVLVPRGDRLDPGRALALLSVPIVHRRGGAVRSPSRWLFTLAALAARYALVGVEAGPTERYTPSIVLWCFALGWLVATARTAAAAPRSPRSSRSPVSRDSSATRSVRRSWPSACCCSCGSRRCRAPRVVARVAGSLAAASLYIYLTHWQIYPYLEMKVPILAVLSSVVVGLAYRQVAVSRGGAARGGQVVHGAQALAAAQLGPGARTRLASRWTAVRSRRCGSACRALRRMGGRAARRRGDPAGPHRARLADRPESGRRRRHPRSRGRSRSRPAAHQGKAGAAGDQCVAGPALSTWQAQVLLGPGRLLRPFCSASAASVVGGVSAGSFVVLGWGLLFVVHGSPPSVGDAHHARAA